LQPGESTVVDIPITAMPNNHYVVDISMPSELPTLIPNYQFNIVYKLVDTVRITVKNNGTMEDGSPFNISIVGVN
jgi:hypothetical protein